jgi:Putative zinc-finger
MTSHATLEELSGFLDTALPEEDRRAVQEHVRGCASCRKRLTGLERVVRELDRMADQAPPGHLERLVAQGIDRLRREPSLTQRLEGRARRFNTRSALPPFFGVVLALGVIIYLLSFAIAREERTATQLILGHTGTEVGAPLLGDRRELAGRVFLWTGEVWAERGTEDVAADRRLEGGVRSDDPALADLVAGLSALDGGVRFRYGGQVLELPGRAAE